MVAATGCSCRTKTKACTCSTSATRSAALVGSRHPSRGGTFVAGVWGAYVFPGSDLIVASEMEAGLFVLHWARASVASQKFVSTESHEAPARKARGARISVICKRTSNAAGRDASSLECTKSR